VRESVERHQSHQQQVDFAYARGKADGHAEAQAEFALQRAVPLLRPSWRVASLSKSDFVLQNTQSEVTMSDVSIRAEMGDFEFLSDTQGPGPFGDQRSFTGRRMGAGRKLGVKFTLSWRDANGDWHRGEVWIEREPIKAITL